MYADLEFVCFELFQSAYPSILVRFKLLLCYVLSYAFRLISNPKI